MLFDICSATTVAVVGSNPNLWQQQHSSNDDNVHSATVKDANCNELDCMAYKEDTKRYFWYPNKGGYDECQIDKSGRWLLIKEKLDADPATDGDNRIIDLTTSKETDLMDRDGAGGHSDNGYGCMVANDNALGVVERAIICRCSLHTR